MAEHTSSTSDSATSMTMSADRNVVPRRPEEPRVWSFSTAWIDTMSPMFFLLKGKYDASGKVLETRGRGYDCMMHRETDYRTREETKSKDERVFEMFMTLPDGSETKMFTHRYRRASKR